MLRQAYESKWTLMLPLLLSGCATVVNNPAPSTSQAQQQPAVNALIRQHNLNLVAYARQINQIVAHYVREVRVEKEQLKMKEAGHPVPLPTGACSAVLTIDPAGQLQHAELAGCFSDFLGETELEAAKRAAPFPPSGMHVNITIRTYARVATPGVDGN